MIAQYTAAALVAEIAASRLRRVWTGITSALQEDILTHATASAWKLQGILDNLETILGIELWWRRKPTTCERKVSRWPGEPARFTLAFARLCRSIEMTVPCATISAPFGPS